MRNKKKSNIVTEKKQVNEKRRLLKAKKLQKKYGINCEIGFVLTFKGDVKLHNLFGDLQEQLDYQVKEVTIGNGKIISVVVDKNSKFLP